MLFHGVRPVEFFDEPFLFISFTMEPGQLKKEYPDGCKYVDRVGYSEALLWFCFPSN